ncbi:MAG: biopolymer transport protein ExbD [Flavobacteriaceae bacterium]
MYKLLPVFGFFLLVSCANDCRTCEKKLNDCLFSSTVPLNLPEPVTSPLDVHRSMITVEITAEDEYLLEGKKLELAELIEQIDLIVNKENNPITQIKIAGDKRAHYDAVYEILAIAQKTELEPVLAYSK